MKKGKKVRKHPNGKIKSVEYYKDHELHGMCTYHNFSGEIVCKKLYINGDLTWKKGEWVDFTSTANSNSFTYWSTDDTFYGYEKPYSEEQKKYYARKKR